MKPLPGKIVLHPELQKILVDEKSILRRIDELAKQINSDYSEVNNLMVISILKGAFMFTSDLLKRLSVPHVVDFMALSTYGAESEASGEVRVIMDLRHPVQHQHVLIVEDILDTGLTLQFLERILQTRNVISLKTCVLAQKEGKETPPVNIDYLGFTIPDVWVVGYGLDYADKHRTLPYIAELKPEVYT